MQVILRGYEAWVRVNVQDYLEQALGVAVCLEAELLWWSNRSRGGYL